MLPYAIASLFDYSSICIDCVSSILRDVLSSYSKLFSNVDARFFKFFNSFTLASNFFPICDRAS